MILGFKKRFAPHVEDESKPQTIRAERKRRPRPGEICHCFTGLRQKGARLLGRWVCSSVEGIRLEWHLQPDQLFDCLSCYAFRVFLVDERGSRTELDQQELAELAWLDGFRTNGPVGALAEFRHYWQNALNGEYLKVSSRKQTLTYEWVGILIRWDVTKRAAAPKTSRRAS